MKDALLSLDHDLLNTSRVPALADASGGVRAVELTVLALAGVTAALLTNLVRLRLGIPGSSIVFATFPMALGFAVVPRRGAGAVMAGSALATTAALGLAGARLDGVGALTSLTLIGLLLDIALRWAHSGWRIYGAFIVAGAMSNAVAFAVRAIAKAFGFLGTGGRQFDLWWPQAIATYTIAGMVAGLISALAWFHYREGNDAANATIRR